MRVLLIVSSAEDASRIGKLLGSAASGQFDVQWVGSLPNSLAKISSDVPAVILLEASREPDTGVDPFHEARRKWPSVPILLLGQAEDELAALQALERGAQDCLPLGIADSDALATAIRRAVARHHFGHDILRDRNLLRSLLDGLPDQVYAKDLQGRFTVVNRATQRFHGVAREADLIGKNDYDLFPANVAASFHAEEQELIRSERLVIDREAPVVSRDNESTSAWSRTHKVAMLDNSGRVVGIVGINRDVTERRRAREQLEQSNEALADRQRQLLAVLADLDRNHQALREVQMQLVQAEKVESIGRLAAGVAHEVKNPLAVLMMALEYLSRCDPKTTDIGPVLRTMSDAVRRADSVVRGLMDLASPSALRVRSASPSDFIHRALQLVNHELIRGGITTQMDIPPSLPQVRVDVGKIEQVLVNLFINAIHAMPKGGTLTIRVSSGICPDCLSDGRTYMAGLFSLQQPLVIIEIEDTGSGIAEANLPKLFEPFFTTKPVGQGYGLGLTVIKTIVDLHGGGIDLRNRPTGGAQATLLLKADGSPAKMTPSNPARSIGQ